MFSKQLIGTHTLTSSICNNSYDKIKVKTIRNDACAMTREGERLKERTKHVDGSISLTVDIYLVAKQYNTCDLQLLSESGSKE